MVKLFTSNHLTLATGVLDITAGVELFHIQLAYRRLVVVPGCPSEEHIKHELDVPPIIHVYIQPCCM